MKKTLALLVATTTLTAAIGLPAWNAVNAMTTAQPHPTAASVDGAQQALPFVFASNDDDDDEGDDDDDEGDDDACDDDAACGGISNPAPAGSVAPPQNGLFGNGAAPKVQVN